MSKKHMETIAPVEVQWCGGESRSCMEDGHILSCDYMMAKIPCDPDEIGPFDDEYIELYAEVPYTVEMAEKFPCDEYSEPDGWSDYTYPILKQEILEQAEAYGIPKEKLIFYWD